jgi:hypothetical protein
MKAQRGSRGISLLTYSMEQSPSWEVTGSAASQEIPAFLEPEVSSPYSQVPATCPYPEPTPSSPTPWRSILILSSHLRLDLPSVLRYIFTLSLTLALDGGWVVKAIPGRFTPGKETRFPLYRRLDEPQGHSGRVRKVSPTPGFDPRTFKRLASPCTDWAVPPIYA